MLPANHTLKFQTGKMPNLSVGLVSPSTDSRNISRNFDPCTFTHAGSIFRMASIKCLCCLAVSSAISSDVIVWQKSLFCSLLIKLFIVLLNYEPWKSEDCLSSFHPDTSPLVFQLRLNFNFSILQFFNFTISVARISWNVCP